MITLEYETEAGDFVAGIDEAGRGPLVGGVFAACVHVPLARAAELLVGDWRAVNDSKKLSEKKREALAAVIRATPGCVWAVTSATPEEIDRLNILKATHLAMRRAACSVLGALRPVPYNSRSVHGVSGVAVDVEQQAFDNKEAPESDNQTIKQSNISSPLTLLVDGLPVPDLPCPSRNIVKGDAKSLLIAAASILAKTARDADCLRLETLYPGYGFAKHKGYPVPVHLEALARLGPCPEHRRTFGPVAACMARGS